MIAKIPHLFWTLLTALKQKLPRIEERHLSDAVIETACYLLCAPSEAPPSTANAEWERPPGYDSGEELAITPSMWRQATLRPPPR